MYLFLEFTEIEGINIKCTSHNVHGLNKSIKRRKKFRWLRQQKNQIAFLQETYSSKAVENLWRSESGGQMFYSHGTNHSKGVMTLISNDLDFEVKRSIHDKNGRFLILDAIINEKEIILVNLYAPKEQINQIIFFKSIQQMLREFSGQKIIIAG